MSTKKNTTGRKANTATADNSVSEYERKHPTGVTSEQRNARAARFKSLAAKIVAKMSGHDRAMLDAAAEAAGMNAADFIAWQVIEERGLGKKRGHEDEFNRWIDDQYENESTRRRNNHEREQITAVVFCYGHLHADGLTRAEEIEVVRRFFKKGDRHLAEAEGRAIKAALAMPSPERMTRAEIEIEAAARIVGKTADEFIEEALQSAIDSAKELNGGVLFTANDVSDVMELING